MIQPLAVQPHTSAAAVERVPRFPPIGRFIPCNSLDERRVRLLRLARAQLCQDRLRALGDVEHYRRAGTLAVRSRLRITSRCGCLGCVHKLTFPL